MSVSQNQPGRAPVDRWSGVLLLSVDLMPTATSHDSSEASTSPATAPSPTPESPAPESPAPESPAPESPRSRSIRAHSIPRPISRPAPARAPRANTDATPSTTGSSPTVAGIPTLDAASPGGADLPPGVRSLATAVTRALPKAAELDPVWFELLTGPLGALRVQFTTDAEGSLLTTEILDIEHAPRALQEVLKRTFLFLRNGRFAVDPSHLSAGTQTLRITGELGQRAPNSNELALPQHTYVMHQEGPTRGKPGLAYVTFNSGRHVEFSIAIE